MNIVAIIPARSGSKGLAKKNIRTMNGKPLISWTIEAALASQVISKVIVSTDSEEIASIAASNGAEVPFLRPKELSQDNSSSIDVIIHGLDYLKNTKNEYFDYVIMLEPTSPLRDVYDIDTAVSNLKASQATSIVSVSLAECHHPAFMYTFSNNLILKPFLAQQPTNLRRQDISPVYFLDGSIYCSEVDVIRERRSFYHENTMAYVVPKWKSLEIDDEYDFIMVESIMKYMGYK